MISQCIVNALTEGYIALKYIKNDIKLKPRFLFN